MFEILSYLSYLDWITPLLSMLDPTVKVIVLDADDIWAVQCLKDAGITVTRQTLVPPERIAFDVPRKQTGLALMKLRNMGINI